MDFVGFNEQLMNGIPLFFSHPPETMVDVGDEVHGFTPFNWELLGDVGCGIWVCLKMLRRPMETTHFENLIFPYTKNLFKSQKQGNDLHF